MKMNQEIKIAAILVVFSLSFACIANAAPIIERYLGQTVFCKLDGTVTGEVKFTELSGRNVREEEI